MSLHVLLGKGQVGTTLAERLVAAGHDVRVLSRSGGTSTDRVEHLALDAGDAAAVSSACAIGGHCRSHWSYGGFAQLYSAAAPCAAADSAPASDASTARCSTPSPPGPPPDRLSTRTRWPRATSTSVRAVPTGPLPSTTCSATSVLPSRPRERCSRL